MQLYLRNQGHMEIIFRKAFAVYLIFILMLSVSWAGNFEGPSEGPLAQKNKSILFLSQDAKNGGISTLYRHFQIATNLLGWQVLYSDGANDLELIKAKLTEANTQFDAIILGGVALSQVRNEVKMLRSKGVVVVGWHALAEPGESVDLFTNISTYSLDVANLAVDYIIESTNAPVGIVLLNDSRFDIANAKTNKMVELINDCSHCNLLEVSNINLGEANSLMPNLVVDLNDKYGESWTHLLAINDSYFDYINYPLRQLKRLDIRSIAAGDGSFLAFSRIINDISQQVATVAEPFVIQGWQLADELNRAFAKEPPSGFIAKPILVTKQKLIDKELKEVIEYSDCEKNYLSIWFNKD